MFLASIGQREFDFTIQTTWAQQGRIECVRAIRGNYHFDVDGLIKAVHLIEKFGQYTLQLSVGFRVYGKKVYFKIKFETKCN